MAYTLGDRLEALDLVIRDWAKQSNRLLKQRLIALGLDERRAAKRGYSRLRVQRVSKVTANAKFVQEKPLIESLGYSLRKKGIEVEAISFRFSRHGIFVEIGVGKNRPKRSSYTRPRPWLSEVLPGQIDELADQLGNAYADLVAQELVFEIRGIYATSVTI
jgi:hypothetical protein